MTKNRNDNQKQKKNTYTTKENVLDIFKNNDPEPLIVKKIMELLEETNPNKIQTYISRLRKDGKIMIVGKKGKEKLYALTGSRFYELRQRYNFLEEENKKFKAMFRRLSKYFEKLKSDSLIDIP